MPTLKSFLSILRDAGSEWLNDNATRLSAALAFYSILSIAPLFVIVTALVGFVFGDEAATGELIGPLRGLLGDAGAEVVKEAVENADRPEAGLVASIIGIITLLFGASGVFGELQSALNTVWDVKPKPGRGIWDTIRDRFLSFGMVLVVGFLLLVSLILTAAVAAIGAHLQGIVPGFGMLLQAVNSILSLLLVTALFAMIYKVLPDVKLGWRDVWLGAFVTAILFTIGKYLIGLYLGRASVATPFGAAGSLVAFVVWIYYSGLILFFGAELTQVMVRRYGRWVEPSDNAEHAAKGDTGRRI